MAWRSDRQGAEHRLRSSGSETETGISAVAGKDVDTGGGTVAMGGRTGGVYSGGRQYVDKGLLARCSSECGKDADRV